MEQTLTCTVRELDASGDPVTIIWKDPTGAVVEESDTTNYAVNQGTIDESGVQNAVLTIKPAQLTSFSSQTTFTYKCSVTSSQYSSSPASSEVDVVANVLTFGESNGDQPLKNTFHEKYYDYFSYLI